MKYIIGNWKSNKNLLETRDWFAKFTNIYSRQKDTISTANLTLVICPPFVLLPLAKELRDKYGLPLGLGVQNISPFAEGAFTGEVTAGMAKEFAQYAIIGHSERREKFGETDNILSDKAKRAKSAGLITVFCIPGPETPVPNEADIVAYEPVWAIGTGKTESPQKAGEVAEYIKKKNPGKSVIYGGSVKAENANSFLSFGSIDGVLPGGSSLDPQSFFDIVSNASSF